MPPINYIISLTTKTKKGMVKINENFLPTLDRHFPQKVKKGKKTEKGKTMTMLLLLCTSKENLFSQRASHQAICLITPPSIHN